MSIRTMQPPDYDELEFFTAAEFSHPYRMSYKLLHKLDQARRLSQYPFIISDSFRANDTNSSHAKGLAVDIKAPTSAARFEIVSSLLAVHGLYRIGVYTEHVHVDLDYSRPFPVLWVGVST